MLRTQWIIDICSEKHPVTTELPYRRRSLVGQLSCLCDACCGSFCLLACFICDSCPLASSYTRRRIRSRRPRLRLKKESFAVVFRIIRDTHSEGVVKIRAESESMIMKPYVALERRQMLRNWHSGIVSTLQKRQTNNSIVLSLF